MSTLLSRVLPATDPGGDQRPLRPASASAHAALAALRAAVLGLVAVSLVVVLAWATAADGRSGPLEAARWAGQVWLLAHHGAFEVGGRPVGLTPLGLLVLPLVLLYGAGGRAVRTSGVTDVRGVVRIVAALSATYAVVSAAVAVAAVSAAVRPQPGVALLAGGLLAVLAGGAGALRAAGVLGELRTRLPRRARAVGRAAAAAAALLVAGGAVLATAALIAHVGRVTDLTRALDAGVVGGAVVALLGVALAPNAAAWGASYTTGAGFAVGAGTSVSPASTQLGAVPAVPLLGALPAHPPPAAAWLVLALPLAAGAVAAHVLQRRLPGRSLRQVLVDAVWAATGCAAALATLAALSGGPLGAGRLAAVGPSPWRVGLAVLLEVAVGSLACGGVLHRRHQRRHREAAAG